MLKNRVPPGFILKIPGYGAVRALLEGTLGSNVKVGHDRLRRNRVAPGLRDDLSRFCQEKHVRTVLLALDAPMEWDAALRDMDWERIEVDGVVIYRIPAD
jgi:hypothetical protein